MSLQGSLDTFALPDVLVLLASTKKSGELQLTGNRGAAHPEVCDIRGSLWFDSGLLVGHDVGRAPAPADAIFELLRLTEGDFVFGPGSTINGHEAMALEPVLAEAQRFLTEWQDIERVVPSLASWLSLAGDAPQAMVSMRADQWKLVVAVGGGCSVTVLVDHLGSGELGGCRAIKDLVEMGLVDVTDQSDHALIGEPFPGLTETPSVSPEPAPVFVPKILPVSEPQFHDPRPEPEPEVSIREVAALREPEPPAREPELPVPEPVAAAPVAEAPPARTRLEDITDFDSLITLPERPGRRPATPVAPTPAPRGSTFGRPQRTLGSLLSESDQATTADKGRNRLAEAQANARRESQPQEEEPGPAEMVMPEVGAVADGEEIDPDEPLNRGLLLKFLSSVRN